MSDRDDASVRLDVGIFAHNEEADIASAVADLSRQSIFNISRISITVHVLANGCTDDTVGKARRAIAALPQGRQEAFHVHDISEAGKSRTWNRFVHALARPDCDLLVCMDADIRISDPDVLARMAGAFDGRPELRVLTSRPVKDLEMSDRALSPVERLIQAGGGTLYNWRKSICGQLYAIRAAAARQVWMPVGLPVEDGFLRAMILTDLLSGPENLDRIDGGEGCWHVYGSETTIRGLVRHQTRIVVGGAVNAMLFAVIRRDAPDAEAAHALLENAAHDDAWLARTESRELPRTPFGYVPLQFLFKRVTRVFRDGWPPKSSGLKILLLAFPLDALVYILATLRMARSRGAGYW